VLPCVDIFVADRFFIWAPILRTCLALRLSAHLADAPLVVLGHPTWVRPYLKVYLKQKFVLIHPPARLFAKCSLVWTFSLRMSFSFGRPSCELTLRCVWAPNFRTCLALHWGGQVAGVTCICVADVHWGAQLADVPCVALGCPTCGRALRCVGVPNLGEAVLKSLPPS
jgi:hypothetical protein